MLHRERLMPRRCAASGSDEGYHNSLSAENTGPSVQAKR